jgi:hypothetical protein
MSELIERLENANVRYAAETNDQAVTRRNQAIKDAIAALRSAAAREAALVEAGRMALNYLENTESELGMTLDSADALRAVLAAAKGDAQP